MKVGKNKQGFTIVELLIVVVVIAVLAAITIVSYNSVTSRARSSALASTLQQVQKKLELFAVESGGAYPKSLNDAGIDDSTSSGVQYSVNNSSSPAGFCITASKDNTSSYLAKGYVYFSGTSQSANQPSPASGVCPGHSSDGKSVANLAPNPAVRSSHSYWSVGSSAGGNPVGSRVPGVTGLADLGITTAFRNTLTGTPTNWYRVQVDSSAGIYVKPGEVYTLSGYVRPSVSTNTIAIIIWINSAGATVIESASSYQSQSAGTWARRYVTATVPAGATGARLQFGSAGSGANGVYVDATAVMFTEGSVVHPYRDGNSPGWVWEGGADASSSRGPIPQ